MAFLRESADKLRAKPFGDTEPFSLVPEALRGGFEAVTERSITTWTARRDARCDEVLYLYKSQYAEEFGLDLESWEAVREALFLREAAFAVLDLDNIRVEALPILERGFKVRIVTKAPGALVFALQSWNTLLLDLLARDPAVAPALKLQDQRLEFVDFLNGFAPLRKPYVFRSADLTSATDLMPRDLCDALVCGVLVGLSLSEESVPAKLLRAGTGNLNCSWPNGKAAVTSRGILMGLPVSWPLLCIYNMWMHMRAWSEASPSGCRLREFSWYRVIGDDYVSYLPARVSNRYTAVLVRTGGLPSEGKDLTSRSAFVFGEEAARLDGTRVRCMNSVSVRALVGEAEWTWGTAGDPAFDLPVQLSQACEKVDKPLRGRICKIVRSSHTELIRRMERAGIPPFVPRWCGGGGFPSLNPNKEFRRCPRLTRAIRYLISSVKQERGKSLQLQKLSSCWTDPAGSLQSPGWVNDALEVQIREFGLVDIKSCPGSVSLSEAHATLLQFWRTAEELAFGVQNDKATRPSLFLVGRRLKEVVDRVNRSLPADRLSDPTEDMVAGLETGKQWVEDHCRIRNLVWAGALSPSWHLSSSFQGNGR
jgi:hypothetical protein